MLQRLPLIVQLADPGQNMVQDLMEEVPVHADVVHIVTSTLPVQLLAQCVILPNHSPPGEPWLHPDFCNSCPLYNNRANNWSYSVADKYDDNDCDDAMMRWCRWGWRWQDWINEPNDEALTFITSPTCHCTHRWRSGHVQATCLPRGGNKSVCADNPIIRVLRRHHMWPVCAPLMSHVSMRIQCRILDPTFTCAVRVSHGIGEGLVRHPLMHDNQSATKQPPPRSGCDQFWSLGRQWSQPVDYQQTPCDLM